MQYLYLIQSNQYHKIGIANDVKSRLAQLQTGNPIKLQIVTCWGFEDAGVVEKALHQKYSSYRVNGEWFEHDFNYSEFDELCKALGGVFVNITGEADPEETEEAEEAGEYSPTLEDVKRIMNDHAYRLEYRYSEKGLRGFAWRLRSGNKECPLYIGKSNPIFEQVREMLPEHEKK